MRLLLIICGVLSLLACKKNKTTVASVKTGDALSRGTNLSNWFNDYSDPAQYRSRFSPATLVLIKAKGFTYVRIPIGSTILYNAANPSTLNANNLSVVDAAITQCIGAGLAVTINLHPWKNDFDSLLANDASFTAKLAAYWKAVATAFNKYDTGKLFFEVYNEPHASSARLTTKGPEWWPPVQGQLIAAVREGAPLHTIIAGGESWNNIDGLLQLQPYPDKRVIYNFHFYDPFLFTHQGASWVDWQPALLARNVPYPSSPAAVAPLVNATTNMELKNALTWYGTQRYNIDSLDASVKRAAEWGKRYGVRIIVNEFGSYKPNAPAQSRLLWLRDVRTVFEKYNIGWALWETDEGFGWITYPGGNRNSPLTDDGALKALGL